MRAPQRILAGVALVLAISLGSSGSTALAERRKPEDRTARAAPSAAPVTSTPAATPTPAPRLTPSPTPSPSPSSQQPKRTSTPTATPLPTTSSVERAITSIEPRVVQNHRSAHLALKGSDLTDLARVLIGEQALDNLQALSATTISGELPAGLCPDTYAATLVDRQGRRTSGGSLLVQGHRAVTAVDARIDVPVKLTGRAQTVAVPLPPLVVEDTTCSGELRLVVSLSPFAHARGRAPLLPQSLTVDGAGADDANSGRRPLRSELQPRGVRHETMLTLATPPGDRQITLQPRVEITVPASAYAGQYSATVTVSIAPESPAIKTRETGRR